MPVKQSYTDINNELDEVLEQLEADTIDVDTAVKLYEKGLKLVRELEARLEIAENTIRELKSKAE